MTQLAENKEIVRRFVEEFLNEANYDTAEEFLGEDIADYHNLMGKTTGRDAVVEAMKNVHSAFPDFAITPEEIIAEGDIVALRMTQRATHEGPFMGIEPTGKSFEIDAMAFLKLEDGKIVERRVRPDMLGLLGQLGLKELPTPRS